MNKADALAIIRKWTGDPSTGEVHDAIKVLEGCTEPAVDVKEAKTEQAKRETR